MSYRTAVSPDKTNAVHPENGPAQHTAIRSFPEHNILSTARTSSGLGRDFSRVPTQTTPSVNGTQSAASCSLSPRTCPFGGACHTCPVTVQAKLTIGQPGDRYEREADRVATQVMRMPDPRLQRQVEPGEEDGQETIQPKPMAAQITPLLQRQFESEEEEETIQAKETGRRTPRHVLGLNTWSPLLEGGGYPLHRSMRDFSGPGFDHNFSYAEPRGLSRPSVKKQVQHESPGSQLLPVATRAFLESRLGESFDTVRIDNVSEQLPNMALAAAEGRHLRFAPNLARAPAPVQRAVVAHEAAHVAQWQRGRKASAQPWSEKFLEAEALQVGWAVANGGSVKIRGIARDDRLRFHPVFISTFGRPGFLNNAARFHERWGYGTPQSVSSIEEIVTQLGSGLGSLDRVTIVSHAVPDNINISFLRGGPGFVRQTDWGLTTPKAITHFSAHSIGLDLAEETMTNVKRHHSDEDWWQRLRPDIGDPYMRQFVWWLADVDHLRRVRPRRAIPRRTQVVNQARQYVREYKHILQGDIRTFAGYGLDVKVEDLDALEEAINQQLRSVVYRRISRRTGHAITQQVLSGRDVAVRRVLGQGHVTEGGFLDSLFNTWLRLNASSVIEIKGCRIGQNRGYLEAMSRFFAYPGTTGPVIRAPDMFQFFGDLVARSHPDSTRRLRRLWRNRRIRRAFLYWANVFGWNLSDPPVADDLVEFLRAGHAFPVGLTLHSLRGSEPGSLAAWFARFGYHLDSAPEIEEEFFEGRRLSTAMRRTIVDWLQDRRRRPRQRIFPSDPEYQNHLQSAQAASDEEILP